MGGKTGLLKNGGIVGDESLSDVWGDSSSSMSSSSLAGSKWKSLSWLEDLKVVVVRLWAGAGGGGTYFESSVMTMWGFSLGEGVSPFSV